MMTASRQIDGVARVLCKSDVERLKSPTIRPKVVEGEFPGEYFWVWWK